MASWAEDITTALESLGGVAPLTEIYDKVRSIRPRPHPVDLGASVRGSIERNSSDSVVFAGKDLFFSVHGIGNGVWGLRSYEKPTPIACDIDSSGNHEPQRQHLETYRILRDTALARQIKLLHNSRCQICGSVITLSNGEQYAEAHHIKPLGNPHRGPDVAENILVLCPNHHVMMDYGITRLNLKDLKIHRKHRIGHEFIEYHNSKIVMASANR